MRSLLCLAVLAVHVYMVHCEDKPLYVFNQVVLLEDGSTTTPNYDAIAENFVNQMNPVSDSFFHIKYQIPIFIGLIVLFCILLYVYCRMSGSRVEERMEVYSLSCSNPGFRGSEESNVINQTNIQEKSTILIENEKSAKSPLPNLPRYLEENLGSSLENTDVYYSTLLVNESLYLTLV